VPYVCAQHESVGRQLAVRAKAAGNLVEVDSLAVLLVSELHCLPAAERRRARAPLTAEILEDAVLAARAIAVVVRSGDLQLQERVRPEIEAQHRRTHVLETTEQDLQGFGGLEI